jgi:hypothetical protein
LTLFGREFPNVEAIPKRSVSRKLRFRNLDWRWGLAAGGEHGGRA